MMPVPTNTFQGMRAQILRRKAKIIEQRQQLRRQEAEIMVLRERLDRAKRERGGV